jgi:hypothetical protein
MEMKMSVKSQTELDVDAVLRDAGVLPESLTPSSKTVKDKDAAKQKKPPKQKKTSAAPPKATSPEPGPSKKEAPAPVSPASERAGRVVRMSLADITRDPAMQMRERLDEQAVRDYAEKYEREKKGELREGEKPFPPIDVFHLPSEEFVRVNGLHRDEAMQRAGIVEWEVKVYEGSREDAARFAATANRTNSAVRVTNGDKQRTATNLWKLLGGVSARMVAELAGVDHKTAEKYRPTEDAGKPRKGKDGKQRRARARPDTKPNALPTTGEVPQSTAPTPGSDDLGSAGASPPHADGVGGDAEATDSDTPKESRSRPEGPTVNPVHEAARLDPSLAAVVVRLVDPSHPLGNIDRAAAVPPDLKKFSALATFASMGDVYDAITAPADSHPDERVNVMRQDMKRHPLIGASVRDILFNVSRKDTDAVPKRLAGLFTHKFSNIGELKAVLQRMPELVDQKHERKRLDLGAQSVMVQLRTGDWENIVLGKARGAIRVFEITVGRAILEAALKSTDDHLAHDAESGGFVTKSTPKDEIRILDAVVKIGVSAS